MRKIFLFTFVSTLAFCCSARAEDCVVSGTTIQCRCSTSGTVTRCYNDKNQVITWENNQNDGTRAYMTYEYDENTGKRKYSFATHYNSDGSIKETQEEVYAENGYTDFRTDKQYTNGVVTWEHRNVYNGHGGQGETGSYTKYYDSEGNVTSTRIWGYDYDPDAENKWHTYHDSSYNSSNIKTWEQLNSFSEDGYTYTVNFDYFLSDGKTKSSSGGDIYACENPFNQWGPMTKTGTYNISYNSDGSINQKNIYDNSGNLVSVNKYAEDGTYESYDAQGNNLGKYNSDGSKFVRLAKRIYTVPEAVEASSKKNTFSIRYR